MKLDKYFSANCVPKTEDKSFDIISWGRRLHRIIRSCKTLFDEMLNRDTVSWNTILDAYVKAGEMKKAFEFFEKMLEMNVVSWSTMISGYSKVGDMEMAKMLFDRIPVKKLVPWTIIISGYAEKGMSKEATRLYNQMLASALKLDEATMISILAAYVKSGLLGLGKRVHFYIARSRFSCTVNVHNALIDMYAKCGVVEKALNVFNTMSKRDLVS